MIAFGVLIALLLGFAFAQTFFRWEWPAEFGAADYVISIALGVFCVLIVIGAFGQKFRLKRLGSYALHFGLVLFLIGSLVYTVTGRSVMTSVPINASVLYSEVEDEKGEVLSLGFAFGIPDFEVQYYEPVYDVYEMTEQGTKTLMTDVELKNNYYDFGKYGKVALDSLVVGGSIKEEIALTDSVVALVRMPVSKYTATVLFEQDGKRESKDLIVNYPLRKNGVKIYLMSYSESSRSVTLLFKKDAGEPISLAGIVLTILGTFFQCLAYPVIEGKGLSKRVKRGTLAPEESGEGGGDA